MTSTQALKKATTDGIAELKDSIWLWSQEEIIRDQAGWSAEDTRAAFDFTKAPYWITDNTGIVIPVFDASDIKEVI